MFVARTARWRSNVRALLLRCEDGDFGDGHCIVVECLDVTTMKVIETFDFGDCSVSKVVSVNVLVDDDDRLLCLIGCAFSHDMLVFALQKAQGTEEGYTLTHTETFPGLHMIAQSRKHKKEVLIHKSACNDFFALLLIFCKALFLAASEICVCDNLANAFLT